MVIISVVLIALNHWNHPHFLAHATSLVLSKDDGFFENWKTSCITIFSFALEFFLVIYFYLALYQYLFMAIVVSRCFNWCLQAITEHSAKLIIEQDNQTRVKMVESAVEKFEHIRALLNDYNGIFRWLLLFCKGILLIQITIMAYIPLKGKNALKLPISSTLIFFALTLHYGTQVIMLLYEMGRVLKVSRQFPELWMRNLQVSQAVVVGGSDSTLASLKMLLDTCSPYGFECAECYLVDTNTVLTYFYIVTSYLIVLFQLQI